MDRDRFFRTYSPVNAPGNGEQAMFSKKALTASAPQVSDSFTVTTQNGSVLNGKIRDWIVQYEDGDYGVVGADIFPQLYAKIP